MKWLNLDDLAVRIAMWKEYQSILGRKASATPSGWE
jgi:hypothetical protein